MKFLVVSDREYKKTSRGMDIITEYLADKNHSVDHLAFFVRKHFQEKQISKNICQLYSYDPFKLYYAKTQFLFPGLIIRLYFRYIMKKHTPVDFSKYDLVILESGRPSFLALEINNKIIYRQSDPVSISFNSNRRFYKKMEENAIKKSLFVISALEKQHFHPEYTEKFIYWHSGFIPFERTNIPDTKKSFVVLGGDLDWKLLNKIAKKYPEYQFHIIGIRVLGHLRENIIVNGYLNYEKYRGLLSSALGVIIPFSNFYVRQLSQVYFTAKILVAMHLGLPVLLRAYGTIQNTDPDKKLFIYNTRKEALNLMEEIINKINNHEITHDVSISAKEFLNPQISENRIKELDNIFQKYF